MSATVHRPRLPLLFSLILFVFFSVPLTNQGHTLALSGPITITSQTYFIHFPDYIDFTIHASDATSTIAKATISMTFGPQQDLEQDSGTVNAKQPGHSVTLQFREDTTAGQFHPPGTPISYYWKISDTAGNTYTEPVQQITTVDTRFSWQHLSRDMLQVNWYNRSQGFGQTMLNQASSNVKRISGALGGSLLHPVNLWIYATDSDFHGSLAPNSYEWVGGEAIPPLNEASIVVANTSDTTLVRDMPHELTHLIFHQLIAQGIYAPTWFDEGLAVYNQIYHEPEMIQAFDDALATHTLIPLSQLEFGFPADANQAYQAYAQSWQLLNYMYNTFGQPKMARLIRQMNNSQTDFNQDLQTVLGEDQLHLENQWYVYLHQPPLISPDQLTPTSQPKVQVKSDTHGSPNASLINSQEGLLIGLGFLLILGVSSTILLIFINVRRQRNRKMAVEAAAQLIVGNGMNSQQSNAISYYGYPDPSTYMRTSMYASLVQQSESQSSNVPDQESLNPMPRTQAPQE